MATYVNDLRLKEIGTGESSGTWGTETNTNLELIGEALGFGTEAITTNADTHTTTVADGSTDPGRAMYIKYTGTLDSACTITIAPNTMSRMHFIENGTSGSQNIIISQGTGANVTIPAGDVKAVYLDGAGSGAAVADAFASLNVVDLKVEDDLTVTDDASIGGDATITGTLGVSGLLTANANVTLAGTTPTLTIGDAGAEDTKIVFDGNAQDFYIALDDSADDLLVGLGSTVGTTPIISITEAGAVTLKNVGTGDDNPMSLTLQTSETDIAANDVLGKISFQAPDEATGTDAILVAAAIQAISEGDFSASSNATSLAFMTGASEAATTKMTLSSGGVLDVDGGITVDNITIDGTEIDLSSGSLTLDVASAIKLDADGGEVQFLDGGTEIGVVSMGSQNINIESKQADKDIVFKGIDGSSDVTALTLDMSEAGRALFNEGIKLSGLNGGTGLAFDLAGSSDFVIKETSTDDVVGLGPLNVNISSNFLGFGVTPQDQIHLFATDGSQSIRFQRNQSDGAGTDGQTIGAMEFWANDANIGTNDSRMKAQIVGETQNTSGGTRIEFWTTNSLETSASEAMRIIADRSLVVGDSAFPSGSNSCFGVATGGSTSISRAATNLQTQMSFLNPNGTVGTIKTTGSATQFNTSSDYRLKENVDYDWDATSRLKQLKPVKFNWISDESNTAIHGFLAHEVSSIVPEAVSGEKDAVYTAQDEIEHLGVEGQPHYQGIDQSKLVPLLVKTIQEMEARLTTLEG